MAEIDRVEFLSDHILALKEAIHTDVILYPGGDGAGIPTHRAVLALRSKQFKEVLNSATSKKAIVISDMSYGELEALLEFMYSGTLSPHNQQHTETLSLAANKFGIPALKDFCRNGDIDRVEFLADHALAFREAIHTDVILKPRDNGPEIPTHKAVLAVRSDVFKFMLEADELSYGDQGSLKTTIHFSEFSHEELNAFVEFLYSGTMIRHSKLIRASFKAAHKYNIQYLRDFCRDRLISSLHVDNVFGMFELAKNPDDAILMDALVAFLGTKPASTIFSERFNALLAKEPLISLQVIRRVCETVKAYSDYNTLRQF